MAILMLLTLALAAAGCDFIRDPEPLGLTGGGATIHSVLVAGSDTVSAFLTRVDPDDVYRYGSRSDPEPISGADVRLASGTDTVWLVEGREGFPACYRQSDPAYFPEREAEPAGPGCYAAVLPGGVRPGGRYELRIRLPGAETVHGVAEVPVAPEIAAPEAWARFREGADLGIPSHVAIEIPARWAAPADAGVVELNLDVAAVFSDGTAVDGGRCSIDDAYGPFSRFTSADSARFAVEWTSCLEPGDTTDWQPLAWDSIHARLRVTVYDSAFTLYQEIIGESSSRPEAASAGLTGALGVFAGAASAERPVVILPEARSSGALCAVDSARIPSKLNPRPAPPSPRPIPAARAPTPEAAPC